jgi:hypothetical protein
MIISNNKLKVLCYFLESSLFSFIIHDIDILLKTAPRALSVGTLLIGFPGWILQPGNSKNSIY